MTDQPDLATRVARAAAITLVVVAAMVALAGPIMGRAIIGDRPTYAPPCALIAPAIDDAPALGDDYTTSALAGADYRSDGTWHRHGHIIGYSTDEGGAVWAERRCAR